MKKSGMAYILAKISQGLLLCLGIMAVFFVFHQDTLLAQFSLYGTMPQYQMEGGVMSLLGLGGVGERAVSTTGTDETEAEQDALLYLPLAEVEVVTSVDGLIRLDDVVFQTEEKMPPPERAHGNLTIHDIDSLRDLTQLRNRFYTVDRRTNITAAQFDIDRFLEADLTIDNNADGPKVLIFHTHSNERFADSQDISQGVIAVGARLKQILEQQHGIETKHVTTSFDIVDGQSRIIGAYERMEPVITQILADNPSIQIAIDLHRDGVHESRRLVTNINGESTAQIMFFNGLSKLYREGVLEPIHSLPNPNIDTNLAFSFQMQLAANEMFPGFARNIYLNAFRYSLHMLPKSLLVEVGAQTNTLQEALNAMEPLAEILAQVVL